MSLKIRLARGGAKKRPYYRIVVADSRAPRDGRFIEKIGALNPLAPKDSPLRFTIDGVKAHEWIKKGAQPTDRVARYLANVYVAEVKVEGEDAPRLQVVEPGVEGAKAIWKWTRGNNPQKAQPGQKAKERAKEREEKEAARQAAAAEA